MKLLDAYSLDVKTFVHHPLPPYILISHTWASAADNVRHHAVGKVALSHDRNTLIAQACRIARERYIQYLWIDALCIDSSSTADVAESVTGSFGLAWDAALCIVYLSDLAPKDSIDMTKSDVAFESLSPDEEDALARCSWFSRVWSLQELVAPPRVEFFDRNWHFRAGKSPDSSNAMLEILSRVSGLDKLALSDRDSLFKLSLGRRLSWASRPWTDRPEDVAYAMMGICGVEGRLAPIYGEGGKRAFHRLQEQILMSTTDLSVLAWQRQDLAKLGSHDGRDKPDEQLLTGILADSPADFQHFSSNLTWLEPFASDCDLTFSNRGLHIQGSVVVDKPPSSDSDGDLALLLNKSWRSRDGIAFAGIRLREIEPGVFVRAAGLVTLQLKASEIKTRRFIVRLDFDGKKQRNLDTGSSGSDDKARLDFTAGCVPPEAAVKDANVTVGQIASVRRQGRSKRSVDDMLETRPGANEGISSGSSSTSEEDIMLFDSLPEKAELLEGDHPLQATVLDLVNLGLAEWRSEVLSAIRVKEKPAPTNLGFPTFSIPLRSSKRARTDNAHTVSHSGDTNSGSESDYTCDTDHENPDMLIVRPRKDPAIPLACPFYRNNPARHRRCLWQLSMHDSRTVKQHVIVDHHIPEYCPVCYAVFESAGARDGHIVRRQCSEREPPIGLLDGVSEDQVDDLVRCEERGTRRGRRKRRQREKERGTRWRVSSLGELGNEDAAKQLQQKPLSPEENKWFRIWDVLFSDAAPPDSAYLSSQTELVALTLRRFWRRRGPELVARVVEKHGLQEWQDRCGESALAALAASVLDGMMESALTWENGALIGITV